MTKKHFILIAECVNRMDLHFADRQHVALMLADALRGTNRAFDRETFIDACMKSH